MVTSKPNYRDYSAISATLLRSENGRVVMIGPDALLFDTFRVFFVSSQGFSKSGNPDVLKLFHRHSVWMIRISVLVKVNGILVKVNGIRHYYFIDLILSFAWAFSVDNSILCTEEV
jgi:hypothetical protein